MQASSLDDNNSVLIRQAPSGMLKPLPFLYLLQKQRINKAGFMRYRSALQAAEVPRTPTKIMILCLLNVLSIFVFETNQHPLSKNTLSHIIAQGAAAVAAAAASASGPNNNNRSLLGIRPDQSQQSAVHQPPPVGVTTATAASAAKQAIMNLVLASQPPSAMDPSRLQQ